MSDKTTICVVNYKTEELTKLCLRSIRKYSKNENIEVIVVDNNSADSSLDYLRTVKWIKLVERNAEEMNDGSGENIKGSMAHGSALDCGLRAASADSKYFIALHSDTFVKKEGWLKFLLDKFTDDNIMVVGCGKLDLKPWWERTLKRCTDIKEWIRRMNPHHRERANFYIRSICAVYRKDIFEKEDVWFTTGIADGFTIGKKLYYEIVKRGYDTVVVDEFKMANYIDHLAHATMVLNPEEFSTRKKTDKKYYKRLKKVLDRKIVHEILADTSLDQ
ncbi:glycosyltransferase family 2 protein [Lentisphaerota bacterium WC36G]|nr:glycosyltransferase family 2 protein [Lentisphaerae bacterium WC36]